MRIIPYVGFCSAMMLFSSLSAAQDPVPARELSDHEIIVQLSNAKLNPVPLDAAQQIDFSLPANWQKYARNNGSVDFKVPYHIGVFGKIELLSEASGMAEDIQVMEKTLNTALHSIETQTLETDYLSGSQAVLSGRSGGELALFMLFSGSLKNGKGIRFYAVCPERWFPAYKLFFLDIIQSVTYPLSRHKS